MADHIARSDHRRLQILAAAAHLISQRGYHRVGMADLGAAAGVTGPAVYRHFRGKDAVLVALFDRVIDDLLQGGREIVATADSRREVLDRLIHAHVTFAIDQHELINIYMREGANLGCADRQRLRDKQQSYLQMWEQAACALHPARSDHEVRVLVHSAIGALHSVATFNPGLPREQLSDLLAATASSCIGLQRAGPAARR